jgi:hypothetical protein
LFLPKLKRNGAIRADLLRIDKWAAAAANNLRQLQAALDDLPPWWRDPIFTHLEIPIRIASNLDNLSNVASTMARRIVDEGGATKMLAFSFLIRDLAGAYQNATGRPAKVTWNAHRNCFEGRFVNLVEAVLPAVCALAGTAPPIRIPKSPRARGKYIYDATAERATRAGKNKGSL